MGQTITRNWPSLFRFGSLSGRDAKIAILGIDAAGKTSILYQLRLGEQVTTIPTIGFNVETVNFNKVRFTMWDIGGQDRIIPLWFHYLDNVDAVIFVVDSNDRERIKGEHSASAAFEGIMRVPSVQRAKIVVLANKQDLPHSMPVHEIAVQLGLFDLKNEWIIQPTCAISGDGLYEGLEWLSSRLRGRSVTVK